MADLKSIIAERFGITTDQVTDAQLKAFESVLADVKANELPTVGGDDTVATQKALEQLQSDFAAEKEQRIEFQRQVEEWKTKPAVDPDETRMAMDRLSRVKSIPEISRLVREQPQDENEKAAQIVWDDLHTLSMVLCNKQTGAPKGVQSMKYWKELSTIAPGFAKALDTATSNEGAEWAPTEYGSTMIDAVWDKTVVAPLFPRIPMPRSPYTLPFSLTGGTVYLAGEATSDTPSDYTASTPATDDVSFTAKKLAMLVNLSEELEEDSIVPVLPQLRDVITKDMGNGIEDAILDGQASGAIDSDVTSAADRRMAWNGLRYFVTQTLTTGLKSFATFDGTNAIDAVLQAMTQKYLDDCVWIFPTKKRFSVCTIVDGSTNKIPLYLRASELGDRTIVSGQAGDILGNPVVFSSRMRTNLNASGVYDGSTTTKTWACLVNRLAWMVGDRREMRLEVERKPAAGYSRMIGTVRLAFSLTQPATDVHTGAGYNF